MERMGNLENWRICLPRVKIELGIASASCKGSILISIVASSDGSINDCFALAGSLWGLKSKRDFEYRYRRHLLAGLVRRKM